MRYKLNTKYNMALIALLIAAMSISVRLLTHYDFSKSALLYIGVPFFLAVALTLVKRPNSNENWKYRYANLVLWSLIIMLGSSIILFEGFLCVLMFMPIYFGIILIVFIFHFIAVKLKHRKSGKLFSHIFPVIIFFSAFEGVSPELSMPRDSQVQVTKIVNASVKDIHKHLTKPMDLNKERHWFLALFPMPDWVLAGTLQSGDIHKAQLTYHRWFFTNTHQGELHLKLDHVDDEKIETTFIKDSTYLATYLNLKHTRIIFQPVTNHQTRVTLVIEYERLLDPAWYFSPLQHFGVEKGAEFLLSEVITPHE